MKRGMRIESGRSCTDCDDEGEEVECLESGFFAFEMADIWIGSRHTLRYLLGSFIHNVNECRIGTTERLRD